MQYHEKYTAPFHLEALKGLGRKTATTQKQKKVVQVLGVRIETGETRAVAEYKVRVHRMHEEPVIKTRTIHRETTWHKEPSVAHRRRRNKIANQSRKANR